MHPGETSDVVDKTTAPEREGRLEFAAFDVERMLQHGAKLVSSAGDEFDPLANDPSLAGLSPKERAAR